MKTYEKEWENIVFKNDLVSLVWEIQDLMS